MAEPISPDARGPATDARPARLPMVALQSIALRLAVLGLNAVTGIITARLLQPEGRGEVAAMIIWPMLLGGITSFGLPNALIYHVRREPDRASAVVGWSLVLGTAITLAGTAISWLILPYWLHRHTPEVVAVAQWLLLTAVIGALTLIGRAGWEAQSAFGRSNTSQVLTPVTVIISLGVLVALDNLTPISAAIAYMLAGLPAFFWSVGALVRTYRPTLGGGPALWRPLLFYGGRAYGVSVYGVLAQYLDQAMVVGFLDSISMGIYAVAVNLARVTGAANTSVAMMMFPRVVGLSSGDMVRSVGRSARLGTMAGAGIGLAVLAAGPILIRLLYGPAFAPAASLLPLLVANVIVSGLVAMLLQGFLASGRPGVATTILFTGLAVSVPLYFVLVPAFGLAGAASSLLSSAVVRLLLTLAAYRSVLRVPTPRVWLDGSDMAELARYRSALFNSVFRMGPTGEAK